VFRCGSKNTHSKEIGLCDVNLLTNLGFIVNIVKGRDLYDHSIRKRLFILTTYKLDTYMSSGIYKGNRCGHDLHLLFYLALIVCFIS
jgi:hypothetical protein